MSKFNQEKKHPIKIEYEHSTDRRDHVENGGLPTSTNSNTDYEEKVSMNRDKLFFPVNNVKFHDLYDFSKSDLDSGKASMKTLSSIHSKKATGQVINQNKKDIALFRYGDDVFAIDEKCPHVGGPLHLGDIEKISEGSILCVVCPWHKWKIELGTGKLKYPQRKKQVDIYPVRVDQNGDLYIGFDEFSPTYFEGTDDF